MLIVINAIPKSINYYIGRDNRFQYQKDKKEFQKIAKLMTLKDRPKQPIEKCNITITYYFKDKRRRDPSNFDKFVLDFLVESGFITDDNYFVIKEFTTKAFVDNKNPRTEIEIIPLVTNSGFCMKQATCNGCRHEESCRI